MCLRNYIDKVTVNYFGIKFLSGSFHKEPMGGGTGEVLEPSEGNKGWKYPPPDSSIENILKLVCAYAN